MSFLTCVARACADGRCMRRSGIDGSGRQNCAQGLVLWACHKGTVHSPWQRNYPDVRPLTLTAPTPPAPPTHLLQELAVALEQLAVVGVALHDLVVHLWWDRGTGVQES